MQKVSVVIPLFRRELFDNLKSALENQTYPIHELIAVEDKEGRGPCWGRNKGFMEATGDWIAFIDDDCVPERIWIESLINAALQFHADVAGGNYIESDPLLSEIKRKRPFPTEAKIDHEGQVAVGGNIMFSRTILEECLESYGFVYNPQFSLISGEDHELCWRLRQLGAKFVFVPCHHLHLKKVNFISYLKLKYLRGRGIARLHQSIQQNKLKPVQKSLIWNKDGKSRPSNWIKAFVKTGIGPFGRKRFSSNRYFIYYWIGEKTKAMGFFYEKCRTFWN